MINQTRINKDQTLDQWKPKITTTFIVTTTQLREREREREPSLSINLKHQPNEKSFGEGIFMRKSAEREQYPKALEIKRSKSDSET